MDSEPVTGAIRLTASSSWTYHVVVIAAIVWLAAAGVLAIGYRSFPRERLLIQL